MRCLCCGKEFNERTSQEELSTKWHRACLKKFFGTKAMPDVDISEPVLERLATESISKGLTVPGVQKKLSLHLITSEQEKPRLTLVNYPTGYILKPQTEEYRALPEAEYTVMSMARATQIKTVPFALVRIPSSGNEFAYITKRIDRVVVNENEVKLIAMEDFCQLENRLASDKYKGSYERCAKVIAKYSSSVGLDTAEFFLRVVFSFVVGNSDMHLKNFSLIETEEGKEEYRLSEAYDLLPVNVIMPQDEEEMALTLNGKKQKIRRKDFIIFAEACKLNLKSAEKMIEKIINLKDTYIDICQNSYLPDDMKESFKSLICERIAILEQRAANNKSV